MRDLVQTLWAQESESTTFVKNFSEVLSKVRANKAVQRHRFHGLDRLGCSEVQRHQPAGPDFWKYLVEKSGSSVATS